MPNQDDLTEMMADAEDDSQAKANFDHLMRATNHLKLAQAEFEKAQKRFEPRKQEQKSPGQSFLYRANSQINEAVNINNADPYLNLHAQPTAYQAGNDHNALRAQEPAGVISAFYDDSADVIEESKVSDPATIQRQNSMDNPPIAQMLRLHKQLSDKKSNRMMSSEEECMMLPRQDELVD